MAHFAAETITILLWFDAFADTVVYIKHVR
jgi:hypothetical protein